MLKNQIFYRKLIHVCLILNICISYTFSQQDSTKEFLSFEVGNQYIYIGEFGGYSSCSVRTFTDEVTIGDYNYLKMHTYIEHRQLMIMPISTVEYDNYVLQIGSKVYGLLDNRPVEMYDYDLNVGDTMRFDSMVMKYQDMEKEMIFIVDSIGTLTLESVPRRVNYGNIFFVRAGSEDRYSLPFATIEGIGFHYYTNLMESGIFYIDQTLLGKFRLGNVEGSYLAIRLNFQNEIADVYDLGSPRGCEIILDQEEVDIKPSLIVAQNPVIGDRLFLRGLENEIKYAIYDIGGKSEMTGKINENGIGVEGLVSGVYFIQILDGRQLVSLKFVK